ncbi:hypothetical protein B0T12DRAFT_273547 [Alternaria alternata]|nr:hypothetical protein B0T12DRAFT_273547 [Alternaria alternata]
MCKTMAKPPLTEKLVYLALKDVFRGDGSQPSTIEEIRKTIEKHKDEPKIGALIQSHGAESVCKVAQDLLKYQIFVSMAKAEVRFPEVFEVLPAQAEQATTTGTKIATSSSAAVRSAGTCKSEELLGIGDRIRIRKVKERARSSSQNQSPGSVSLPLWDQHRVLVKVQYALEKACFTFAQKRLENVLQKEGWDCAEAVELNRWPKVLLTYPEDCNLNGLNEFDESLPNLLDSVTQLRHDTVHRVRLSSTEILQHLTDAVMFAQLLRDDECSEFISTIRRRTQDAIEELVRNKAILDRRLDEIKSGFTAKRAELDRQEAAALEAAVRKHIKPTIYASDSLDSSHDDPGGIDAIQGPWKHVCDSALLDDEPPKPAGIIEKHAITSATEPATELAVTQVPDAADDDNGKTEEAKKKTKEEKKKSKKKKKAAKEQAKQQEEAEKKAIEEGEDIGEPSLGGGVRDDAFEHSHEGVATVKLLSVPLTFVPIVDSGPTEEAFTDGRKDAEEGKTEDRSDEEQFFECSEIMVSGHESDSKHRSKCPSLEQQVVATDSTNLTSEGEVRPAMVSEPGPTDPGTLAYDKGSFSEQPQQIPHRRRLIYSERYHGPRSKIRTACCYRGPVASFDSHQVLGRRVMSGLSLYKVSK